MVRTLKPTIIIFSSISILIDIYNKNSIIKLIITRKYYNIG